MTKKQTIRKLTIQPSYVGGDFYEMSGGGKKHRKITKIRCDGCGRDNSLKVNSRADDGNHYLICTSCGKQPMVKDAKSAFKRPPEKEIVEASGRIACFSYDRNSRNPNHGRAYDGYKHRASLAADRASAEIKRLKKALVFYTEGAGVYEGWTVEQLLEEMDAHDT